MMKIYVCRGCFESRETHGKVGCGQSHVTFVASDAHNHFCGRCKRYFGQHYVELVYTPESIFVMEHNIEGLRERCRQLEGRCEVLENHIKYKPGGEGEFEALCSFYKAADSEIKS